jgi:hypothetical protein
VILTLGCLRGCDINRDDCDGEEDLEDGVVEDTEDDDDRERGDSGFIIIIILLVVLSDIGREEGYNAVDGCDSTSLV